VLAKLEDGSKLLHLFRSPSGLGSEEAMNTQMIDFQFILPFLRFLVTKVKQAWLPVVLNMRLLTKKEYLKPSNGNDHQEEKTCPFRLKTLRPPPSTQAIFWVFVL
jgi:hypothetical protein